MAGSAPLPPLAVAETVTVLFGASTSLSTAVIVRVVVALNVKSPAAVAAPAAAATVRVIASFDLPDNVAVPVLAFVAPLSSIAVCVNTRVTVGVPSTSVMVMAVPVTVMSVSVPSMLMLSLGSSISSSVGVSAKSI